MSNKDRSKDRRPRPTSEIFSQSIHQPFFSEVIDADHATINAYAARLKATTTSNLPLRAYLRDQAIWRLIRHDISEDLVMRPAFSTYLPNDNEGASYSAHDRDDHARAKTQLLSLCHLPLDHRDFLPIVTKFFRELAEHMQVESGQQIPRLEAVLSREESRRLGREYLRTQILKPDLVVGGRRIWRDVEDYARSETERFREVLKAVELERKGNGGGIDKGRL